MSNNPIFLSGHVVEVRALGEGSLVHSGYYSDIDQMEKDIEVLDCTGTFKGIYTTLNMVNPDLLSRRANRISRSLKGDSSTGDADIIRRVWLPIDIDPIRPAGISATDEEHDKALTKVRKIKRFLSEIGWPEPIVADSGNGAHLLYRIDLPNDDEATLLVKNCLTTLHQFFSDGESEVDLSVYNVARIWKMYGTVSRKGDNTKARPHRPSTILSVPHAIQVVLVSDLMHLGSMMAPVSGMHTIGGDRSSHPAHSTRDPSHTSVIDLGEWLLSHGIGYAEKPYHGGRLFVLDECPFSGAHKDGAYAIQFDNGAIFAGCHHNSCGAGEQRWPYLRERFDGPRVKKDYDERRKERNREYARAKREFEETRGVPERKMEPAAVPVPVSVSVPEPVPASPDIALEATKILREGDPIQFMLETFSAEHVGDLAVAKCLSLSMASRSVINSKGLHVLVTGFSGKGKSHTFDTMLRMAPPDQRLDGRMSDKALFYTEDLTEGSIICLDDISLSDAMQEILKGVTTSFQNEFVYRTVDKDRRGVRKVIPKRCVWWVAKMEGTGDDQVWNRMLTCWIDDSKEQDQAVLELELEAAAEFPTGVPSDSREMLICQQIWQQVQDAHVLIPYAKRIRFSSISNRRNPGMLLDMIRSIAVMNQFQRERAETSDGMPVIYATEEDFHLAVSLYIELTGESGSQEAKLTKAEDTLIRAIRRSGRSKVTRDMLRGPLARSDDAIRKALHGYPSHGKFYSGLIEKCPALGYFDGTQPDEEGINRRVRYYTWDEGLYLSWLGGSGIWLASEDEGSSTYHDGDKGSPSPGGTEAAGSNPEAICFQDKVEDTGLDEESKEENKEFFLENDTRKQNANSLERENIAECPLHVIGIASGEGDGYRSEVTGTTNTDISANMPGSNSPPGASGMHPASGLPPRIDPDHFTATDGVKMGPCSLCGKKWVNYLEKGYPKKGEGRKLCRSCYSAAVAREVMSHTTLPGVIEVPNLVRVHADLGRCKVCGQGRIEWIDKERGVYLCELCRIRESGRGGERV